MLPLSLRPYRDAFVFGAVVLVLILRPQGLISSKSGTERV
jgi:branched-chain amino acid transport system permease protein